LSHISLNKYRLSGFKRIPEQLQITKWFTPNEKFGFSTYANWATSA